MSFMSLQAGSYLCHTALSAVWFPHSLSNWLERLRFQHWPVWKRSSLSNRWASIFGKLWKWQLLKLCEWCHWQFMRVARITCEVTLSSWRWFFQNSPLVTAQEKCIDAVLYSIIWLVVKLQLDHIATLVHECPIMIHLHLHSMGLRAWLPYCIVCT